MRRPGKPPVFAGQFPGARKNGDPGILPAGVPVRAATPGKPRILHEGMRQKSHGSKTQYWDQVEKDRFSSYDYMSRINQNQYPAALLIGLPRMSLR
jgi:hypothetical protein